MIEQKCNFGDKFLFFYSFWVIILYNGNKEEGSKLAKSIFSLIRIFRFLTDKDVEISKKLLFAVPFVYLLLPIDLVSDFFPLAGQLDDVAVFVLMWPLLKTLLSNYSGIDYGGKKKKPKDAIDIDKNDYKVE